MQFGLLGDHADGRAAARALTASGRHQLIRYSGSRGGAEALRADGLSFSVVADAEEILADPAVEAVIVAGPPSTRPAQLRRALQSERHVLCVHPSDHTPDTAYEAALLQGDTKQVLLPLLTEGLHPAVRRLSELARDDGPLGVLWLVSVERWAPTTVTAGAAGAKNPAVQGWDLLRRVRGEVAEVLALASGEEADPAAPLLIAGRFEVGGLFQMTFLQGRPEVKVRLHGSRGQALLSFCDGLSGPAQLTWTEGDQPRVESWENDSPWPSLVEAFEAALSTAPARGPTWQDEVRALELDDAVRRSVAHRRASLLEYPEATEEVSFKGTMTLVGCGLLWGLVLLLILSRWLPWLGWVVLPLLVVFLALQLLRWILPRSGRGPRRQSSPGTGAPPVG